jgi:FAD-dependent urate hydroxylase
VNGAPIGLPALEVLLAREMELLNLPSRAWMKPAEDGVRDVAIVGGGLCGLTAAAALRLYGISNIVVLDRAPTGREGPWRTYARMRTLRTAKDAMGPALGLPSLTPRAWFEAQHGAAAWEAMPRFPREAFMDYLAWYRRVLALPVENEIRVADIRPQRAAPVELATSRGSLRARRVVLATGIDGLGGPAVPSVIAGIDRRFWAHSSDEIDFDALRGKRVAVVGAGASAMDNAAMALEAGAARLDLLIRRPAMPRVDKFTGIGGRGMSVGYVALPDAVKWSLFRAGNEAQLPAPRHSVLRVSRHAQAHFHLGSPILAVAEQNGALLVDTPRRSCEVDFLIFATGFAIDFARRPELSSIAPHIRLWRDSYTPPPGGEDSGLAAFPYLGPDFSLRERAPGECPGLSNIAVFNFPSVLSHGKLTSGVPAVSEGAHRLARGLVRSLFVEDADYLQTRFAAYDTPELHGDEWIDADAPETLHV